LARATPVPDLGHSSLAAKEFAIRVNSSEKDDKNSERKRLIFQEAGSFANSFGVFSRNPSSFKRSQLLSKFLSAFLQEAGSFANSFDVFSGNPSTFKRTRLLSKFLSAFLQEPDSF